jgi:U3 small nucleolar RNA-associated protein 6
VSDFALVRRQFQIYERALKKFGGDVALWVEYINAAKRERARALVGRLTARSAFPCIRPRDRLTHIRRALQLHPNTPALYVLAAAHELEHLAPAAARTLLQRGLRLNADSAPLWAEYVKMELGFVESLRRRWAVLGIGATAPPAREQVDTDLDAQAEADLARQDILKGAIVQSAIASAVKGADFGSLVWTAAEGFRAALPTLHLFELLRDLIAGYPSPNELKQDLLSYLYELLHATLPNDPHAAKMYATRSLIGANTDSEAFVDALRAANEELLAIIRGAHIIQRAGLDAAYAEFVEEWSVKDIDDSLVSRAPYRRHKETR